MQGLLIKISEMPMKNWSFKKNATKTLTLQGALIKVLKMQGDANKTLKFQEECRQDFDIAWTCNTNFRCWRKVTLSKFWRHDVKQHHSEGRWCGLNFRVAKWHNLEERRCSLDLQGTRRCLQEISDAKHILETWEDVHKRGEMPCRLHSLQKRLKILFYSTTKNQLMFIISSRKAE